MKMVRLESGMILRMPHHPEDRSGQIHRTNLHRGIEKEPIQATNRLLELHEKEPIPIAMHPQLERLENVPIQATNHHQEPIGGEQILIQMKNHKGDENEMIPIKVHNEIPFMILTNRMARNQRVKWPMVEKLESIPRIVLMSDSLYPFTRA